MSIAAGQLFEVYRAFFAGDDQRYIYVRRTLHCGKYVATYKRQAHGRYLIRLWERQHHSWAFITPLFDREATSEVNARQQCEAEIRKLSPGMETRWIRQQ